MELKARIVPLATCNSTTKDVMDPLTMTATIQNIGTSTIPAGMYCEIVCGALTTTGTTTVNLAPGASIIFGQGAIHTIPEAWGGQTFNVTTTVWLNSTKAEQLDTYTCPNILTVNPVEAWETVWIGNFPSGIVDIEYYWGTWQDNFMSPHVINWYPTGASASGGSFYFNPPYPVEMRILFNGSVYGQYSVPHAGDIYTSAGAGVVVTLQIKR